MANELKVIIYPPYIRITKTYITYVVDMEVNIDGKQQRHEYISYRSIEEAMTEAEEQKEIILQASATLDAWLAAHG